MRSYSLTRISDSELTRELGTLVSQDRLTTAMLLAHIAEFDTRRLYLPAAYPSMHAYCVHELGLSEDAAYKRIQAARAARRFPAIFHELESGRLNLASVRLLSPYLREENASEMIAAAADRTARQIEEWLSARFPRTETLGLVETLSASSGGKPALRHVESYSARDSGVDELQIAAAQNQTEVARIVQPESCQHATWQVGTHSCVSPTAQDRFFLRLSIGRATRDKLQHAQNLLGHQLPAGELAQVLERALDALIEKLERRKCGAAKRPRHGSKAGATARHVPAHVRRTVWERDGGQCTFVSASGRRCAARKPLEFDHVEPVARGGTATVAGIRLRCRAHNQHSAELAFGADFMRRKRDTARGESEDRRRLAAARGESEDRRRLAAARAEAERARQQRESAARAEAVRAEAEHALAAAEELIVPLRMLGFGREEARRAAEDCGDLSDASLEIRLRRALACLRPRTRALVSPRDVIFVR
ncbi:MAG: HNH endonuclease [Candidatus Eiseniibacteriota bacterium]